MHLLAPNVLQQMELKSQKFGYSIICSRFIYLSLVNNENGRTNNSVRADCHTDDSSLSRRGMILYSRNLI